MRRAAAICLAVLPSVVPGVVLGAIGLLVWWLGAPTFGGALATIGVFLVVVALVLGGSIP